MGRKKHRIDFSDLPDAVKPPEIPVPPAPTVEPANGFLIPLSTDGKILWDALTPELQAQLRSLVGSSEVIPPEFCGKIYDALGKVLTFCAVKFKGVPADIASEALTFNEAEKKQLNPPTAKIVNKYAPAWLIKFQDEIALGLLFTTIVSVKMQFMQALVASRAAEQVDTTPEKKPN